MLDEMEWDNLLSGLVGAALGLVGAVVIDWRGTRRLQGGAARALFMEVAANGSALQLSKEIGVYVPLVTTAWTAEQTRLAHALSSADFVVVATYYMRVEAIRNAGFPSSGTKLNRMVKVATETFDRGERAAAILERRGWWPWERKALKRRLGELQPRDTET